MHYNCKPICITMQKYIQSYVVLPSLIHTPLIIYKDVQYENQLYFMHQNQTKTEQKQNKNRTKTNQNQNQNQNQNIKN